MFADFVGWHDQNERARNAKGRGLSTSSIAPADVRLRTVQSMAAPLKAMDPAFNVRWRIRERFSFMATQKTWCALLR